MSTKHVYVTTADCCNQEFPPDWRERPDDDGYEEVYLEEDVEIHLHTDCIENKLSARDILDIIKGDFDNGTLSKRT